MPTTVQSILQEYFEPFAQNHPLSLQQRLAAERMRDCPHQVMETPASISPLRHLLRNRMHHMKRSCPRAIRSELKTTWRLGPYRFFFYAGDGDQPPRTL
jgi:hypothetical protein